MESLAALIATSSVREAVVEALRTVPGLPPIVQSLHIVSIAVLLAAVLVPQLKVLGIAASGQSHQEMVHRLRPWAWTALLALFMSGAVFVVAQPERYFSNPVAAAKLVLVVAALTTTWIGQRWALRRQGRFGIREKLLAGSAATLWCAVILAGRWIAYADYLYWEG